MKRQVICGDVKIGGGAPISIQSMTNTKTADVPSTMRQIDALTEAGCEIIRLAVPDRDAAEALKEIKRRSRIPVVADIHFDYRLALASMEAGVDKIRINPGNIGGEENVRKVVEMAKARRIPIRVGVNSGSLEKDIVARDGGVSAEGLAESALRNVRLLEKFDFEDIVISLKSSNVKMNDQAYRIVDDRCDYPLHIGVTEAGTPARGRTKSAAGIGALLLSGIGDTLRVSLTADPVQEVLFARELLDVLDIRKSGIEIVSCPTCGRTEVDLERIIDRIEQRLEPLKKTFEARRQRPGVLSGGAGGAASMKIAVMGCVVNGPGEAREADIGVACGKGKGVLIRKGEILRQVTEENIPEEICRLAEEYAEITYGIHTI
ncbi:MAG: flavodoxin-dependent (E)-4-hydroxy-3-methylbut-2-enyl-diphosphate synthase [Firmicutes bacterium]|nr:flavodoxin-dependent (E)-4-hydroxy-3-methylbut-2-enyl-diphosphate synthase [Bacillota bacterium]